MPVMSGSETALPVLPKDIQIQADIRYSGHLDHGRLFQRSNRKKISAASAYRRCLATGPTPNAALRQTRGEGFRRTVRRREPRSYSPGVHHDDTRNILDQNPGTDRLLISPSPEFRAVA